MNAKNLSNVFLMIRKKINVFHLITQVVVEHRIDLFRNKSVKNYAKNQLKTFGVFFCDNFQQETMKNIRIILFV